MGGFDPVEFFGGFFGWLHWQKQDKKKDDAFHCDSCGKEISEEQYEEGDKLCESCSKK